VSCKISDLLRHVDKEYSFTANYFKGNGNEYADWKERFRPGKRYLPPIRVLGGNRQDAAFEGALPVSPYQVVVAFTTTNFFRYAYVLLPM